MEEEGSPTVELVGLLTPAEERETLMLSFETSHAWLKHYDGLLLTITTFVAGIILGFIALNIDKGAYFQVGPVASKEHAFAESAILTVLLIFSGIIVGIMLVEVQSAWRRVVKYEKGLGFYRPLAVLNGQAMLPDSLQETPDKWPTFFKLAFWLHGVLFIVVWLHPFL